MTATRRLAAILAADVAGYSRLMGADEEGTHERLQAHLRELVNPKIAEHRGRVVKNTGDGMLAEFSSVVDAVRCAAEVQRAMADRNAETAEDKRITFRVGINLGDVIAEPDDIYGDSAVLAFGESPLKTAPTFHAPGLPAFGYPAAAATASGTRFGAGVSRTPTAETIAASAAKPASA
jgi:hypothetical protein